MFCDSIEIDFIYFLSKYKQNKTDKLLPKNNYFSFQFIARLDIYIILCFYMVF